MKGLTSRGERSAQPGTSQDFAGTALLLVNQGGLFNSHPFYPHWVPVSFSLLSQRP